MDSRYRDTIYALATPPGRSSVAVVRVAGDAARRVFEAITKKKWQTKPLQHIKLANLYDVRKSTLLQQCEGQSEDNNFCEEEIFDQALVLCFNAPKSFTGEDVVEFHVHGGIAIIKSLLLNLECFPGIRLADPGEFSRRALENGKMSLRQAEGILASIHAENQRHLKQVQAYMRGDADKILRHCAQGLITVRAACEASIDFEGADDSADVMLSSLVLRLEDVFKKLKAFLDGSYCDEPVTKGFTVALLGPPNAGKSSLFNALTSSNSSIVWDEPGTTRDIIQKRLEFEDFSVTFLDTAGIRDIGIQEVGARIEAEGQRRALSAAQEADLCLIVRSVDSGENLSFELGLCKKIFSVMNKSDLLPAPDSEGSFHFGDEVDFLTSSKTENGVQDLLEAIVQYFKETFESSFAGIWLPRAEYRAALKRCVYFLCESIEQAKSGVGLEFVSDSVKFSLEEIDKILKFNADEKVLEALFSQFCIGK